MFIVNAANPGQTVNKNSVKKNTLSFKSEKSYHFIFGPKLSIHSNNPMYITNLFLDYKYIKFVGNYLNLDSIGFIMARFVRYRKNIITGGLSMGSALAMILSYVEHNSILWAIFHGILSWFYVLYFVVVYRLF